MTPIAFSFHSGPLHYRRLHATLRNEAIARAAGLGKGFRPIVLDATAGLGQDSFILASLGCDVWLFERVQAVFDQLSQIMEEARQQPELAPILARMHLSLADAHTGLLHPPVCPDVVYLDPMFPEKSGTAAVRKSMQLLQQLAGTDADADALLPKALSCATRRVVVKRPRLAAPLAGMPPDFSLKGASSRFDIYLRQTPHGHAPHFPESDSPP